MNHRIYEEWLFAHLESEDELTPQEAAALQEHLQDCTACRQMAGAWQEVDQRLRAEPMLEPAPGFTSRWESRLEARRGSSQRLQILSALAFCLGGALVLVGALAAITWPVLRSPSVLLWVGVYRLLELFSYVETAQGFLSDLIRLAAGGVPVVWLVIVAGMLCELGVLWVVSFRLLTNPRRITK